MKSFIPFLALSALVIVDMHPSMAQVEDQIKKANAYINEGSSLLDENKTREALDSFRKAYELFPNHAEVKSNYAAALFYWAQGGTFRGGIFYPQDVSSTRSPRDLLASCPLLKEAAEMGAAAATHILNNTWKDCASNGDRLYLDSDGVIRIRGTAGGGGINLMDMTMPR